MQALSSGLSMTQHNTDPQRCHAAPAHSLARAAALLPAPAQRPRGRVLLLEQLLQSRPVLCALPDAPHGLRGGSVMSNT